MEQVIIILNQFFQWVLTTSAMASVMVGLILLAKLILKDKLNIRWHYFLWILVIARLILPWTPESSFSVFNLLNLENPVMEFDQKITSSENTSHQSLDPILSSNALENETEATYSEQSNQQAAAGENKMVSWFSFIMLAWLTGVFSLFTYICVCHKRFAFKVNSGTLIADQRILKLFDQCKNSMRVRKNISLIKTSVINSPTLYGSIRPRLLLPQKTIHTFTDNELIYIFCHELAHFKRHDIIVNWLMTSLLILHWFNPILWYAYFRMREDQEMACDALALSFISPNESTEYGYTIIKLLESYSRFPSTPGVANFSGNKSQLKRRIKMIKFVKTNPYKWSVLGIVLFILLGGTTLTSAKALENHLQISRHASHHSISADDVSNIRLWGNFPDGNERAKVTIEARKNIIDWFNSATDIRQNQDFKGTTPESGLIIELKSGESISILRSGIDFEVQRDTAAGTVSYLAKQYELRLLLNKLAEKNEPAPINPDQTLKTEVISNVTEWSGHQYIQFANGWTGQIEGRLVTAAVGALRNDLKQGVIHVIVHGKQNENTYLSVEDYPTLIKHGPIQIEGFNGLKLNLMAKDGTKWIFDLNTNQFTEVKPFDL